MFTKELTISNQIAESEKLYPFLLELWKELGLTPSLLNPINLALEEALVNSIQYAYPDGKEGKISLTVLFDEEKHTLIFIQKDQGIPFDPTGVADADVSAPLEERKIGGLGIFLVRQIMDSVEYEYKDLSNILTMEKKVK